MKKHISHIITLAAITGLLVIAGNAAQAQTTDPLLADSIDQSVFPQITVQPVDQTVPIGSDVTLSVQANNADGYQWLRNGVSLDGQTNDSLTIQNAGIDDVGLYSCNVFKGDRVRADARSQCVCVYCRLKCGRGQIEYFFDQSECYHGRFKYCHVPWHRWRTHHRVRHSFAQQWHVGWLPGKICGIRHLFQAGFPRLGMGTYFRHGPYGYRYQSDRYKSSILSVRMAITGAIKPLFQLIPRTARLTSLRSILPIMSRRMPIRWSC